MQKTMMTVTELVRTINGRTHYTYFSTPTQRVRIVEARTRKTRLGDREFQVRGLHDGKWFTCCPTEISVEG